MAGNRTVDTAKENAPVIGTLQTKSFVFTDNGGDDRAVGSLLRFSQLREQLPLRNQRRWSSRKYRPPRYRHN